MIGVVCALLCEAKPLIGAFDLKPFKSASLFPVYTNGSLFLVVSGMGKVKSSAALTYLYSVTGERPFSAWLNLGVGGHPRGPIGWGCLAHQVIDKSSGQTFYPSITWKTKTPKATVYTVDQVENEFHFEGVYEMESAGFCSAAFHLTVAELIQCFKIVSDTPSIPPRKDPDFVEELVASQLESIQEIIRNLRGGQNELISRGQVADQLIPFTDRWSFTETQLYQLQRALQKLEALTGKACCCDLSFQQCKKAKDVLAELHQRVSQCFL